MAVEVVAHKFRVIVAPNSLGVAASCREPIKRCGHSVVLRVSFDRFIVSRIAAAVSHASRPGSDYRSAAAKGL